VNVIGGKDTFHSVLIISKWSGYSQRQPKDLTKKLLMNWDGYLVHLTCLMGHYLLWRCSMTHKLNCMLPATTVVITSIFIRILYLKSCYQV